MKIPDPVRRFYEYFPLKTYETAKQQPKERVLYTYNTNSVDPDCILAHAILTWYDVPFSHTESSPYITPSLQLPVLAQDSRPLFLSDIVAAFVPEHDRQEVELLAVVEKAKNAYYRLASTGEIRKNYLKELDQQRLWPLNKVIERQAGQEVRAKKGFFDTSDVKLAVALEVIEELVHDRQGLNYGDLAIYAVTRALDGVIDLPREIQRHLVRVDGMLEPQIEGISIEFKG